MEKKQSRQRTYQLKHRQLGLCQKCDDPVAVDKKGHKLVHCERHRRIINVTYREANRKRVGRERRYPGAESYNFQPGE